MATLKPSITFACSDCTTDNLSFTVIDDLPINGDVAFKKIKLLAATAELVEDQTIIPTTYNKVYIFAKNIDTAATVTLGLASNDGSGDDALDSTCQTLAPGEFVFMSWASSSALVADTTHDGLLEVYIWEATA